MIRSLACIALGSIVVATGSWWDDRQGEDLGAGSLDAIKGRDINQASTNLACEYEVVAPPQVIAIGGCNLQPNGTVCVRCSTEEGASYEAIVDNTVYRPGSKNLGQAHCNTLTQKNGKCMNAQCIMPVPVGPCTDAIIDAVGRQATTIEYPPN